MRTDEIKNIVARDDDGEIISDPFEYLAQQVFLGKKTPSITLHINDVYSAGIDFMISYEGHPEIHGHFWFWPGDKPNEFYGDYSWKPRFDNFKDALIESFKNNLTSSVIHITPRPHGAVKNVHVKIREWFDNEDYVEDGFTQKLWAAIVKNAETGKPILYKGSDDPLE